MDGLTDYQGIENKAEMNLLYNMFFYNNMIVRVSFKRFAMYCCKNDWTSTGVASFPTPHMDEDKFIDSACDFYNALHKFIDERGLSVMKDDTLPDFYCFCIDNVKWKPHLTGGNAIPSYS